ncbi:MAG TPA: di-trans,poly-cis-decaprenylcistransferase [Gemmatimonadaceae bacterium]
MQRSLLIPAFHGLHVAVIMDGNGRWASARGLPRTAGHRAGAAALRRIVEHSPAAGIGTLTVYAFSSDNWARPAAEVDALMRLFRIYLHRETARCIANSVRLSVVGRRDRLAPALRAAIAHAEHETARGRTLHLRIAVDYSARDAIVRAAGLLAAGAHGDDATPLDRTRLGAAIAAACGTSAAPDVDLLVRTGGEQRLSDFLLWECAYAELLFSPRMWPDFGAADLDAAVREFHDRDRRFGRISAAI